jgi:CheY-like chemotaxis protein
MPQKPRNIHTRYTSKFGPTTRSQVIASSGLTEPVKKAELEQLGVKTFLVKPYNTEALLKTVAQALSHN